MKNNKNVYLIICLILLLGNLFAQNGSKKQYKYAQELFDKKEYLSALNEVSNYIYFNKDNSAAYYLRANINRQLKYFKDAINDYNQVVAIDPENCKAREERGILNFYMLADTLQMDDFNYALKNNCAGPETYFALGRINYNSGNNQQALGYYNKAIELDPLFSAAYRARAQLKDRAGLESGAVFDYAQAIKYQPDFYVYFIKGKASYKLKNNKEAIAYYDKALSIVPTDADIFYYRGTAKLNLEDYEGALNDFNRSIELDSANATTYLLRALVFGQRSDYVKSVKDLDKCISLKPNNAEAYFVRGQMYFNMKMKSKGCIEWQKADELGWQEAGYYIRNYCE